MEIPTPETSMLVMIDLQQRLLPAMADPEAVVRGNTLLLRGATELKLDILASEQYPKGLGPTVPEISTWLPDGTPVVSKTGFSVFCEAEFCKKLQEKPRKTLIFSGVETHVCVLQSILDAVQQGFQTVLVSDAVGSRKESDKLCGIEAARQAGAMVLSAEALLFMLLRNASHPAFKAVSKLVK